MPTDPSPTTEHFTGLTVVDQDNHVIGEVSDVIFDDTTNRPAWMVVKPGRLRAEHYAPVEGAYITDDGRVVVPFDKQWLHSAPKASGSHVLDGTTIEELVAHYDVATG